jgi:hypothetical protein
VHKGPAVPVQETEGTATTLPARHIAMPWWQTI